MIKKFNRGFTLIELLVVIAIIGILSSVVLASLNTARTKGADAAIKSNLNNTRAQAELYYDANGSYGAAGTGTVTSAGTWATNTGVCASAGANVISPGVAAAAAAAGATANCNVAASGAAWAASSPLKTASLWWCVDSTGQSKQEGATLAGATVCA